MTNNLQQPNYYDQFFIDLAKSGELDLANKDIDKIIGSGLSIEELNMLKTFAIKEHFDFASLCMFVSNVKDFTKVNCMEAYESYVTCKNMIKEYHLSK